MKSLEAGLFSYKTSPSNKGDAIERVASFISESVAEKQKPILEQFAVQHFEMLNHKESASPLTEHQIKKHHQIFEKIIIKTKEISTQNLKSQPLPLEGKAHLIQNHYREFDAKPEIFKKNPAIELKMIKFTLQNNSEISVFEMMQNVKKGEEIFEEIQKSSSNSFNSNSEKVKCLVWYLTSVGAQDTKENEEITGNEVLRFRDVNGKVGEYIKSANDGHTSVLTTNHFRNLGKRDTKYLGDSEYLGDSNFLSKSASQNWGIAVNGLPGGNNNLVFDKLKDGTTFIKAEKSSIWSKIINAIPLIRNIFNLLIKTNQRTDLRLPKKC